MTNEADEIAKLIEKLKEKGAKVTVGDANGSAITTKALDDLRSGGAPQAFDAWVSWTKSF